MDLEVPNFHTNPFVGRGVWCRDTHRFLAEVWDHWCRRLRHTTRGWAGAWFVKDSRWYQETWRIILNAFKGPMRDTTRYPIAALDECLYFRVWACKLQHVLTKDWRQVWFVTFRPKIGFQGASCLDQSKCTTYDASALRFPGLHMPFMNKFRSDRVFSLCLFQLFLCVCVEDRKSNRHVINVACGHSSQNVRCTRQII